MAPEWTRIVFSPEATAKTNKWEQMRSHELPMAEVREFMEKNAKWPLNELDIGARRRRCEWDLDDQLLQESFRLLMPDLQGLRSLSRVLKLRGNLELAQGQFDAALRTIQTGFTLGRHIAEAPTMIHALVGLAVIQQFTLLVEEWIATPNAPNLYWSLATLPQPMVTLHRAVSFEIRMVRDAMPSLERLQQPMPEAESNELLRVMLEKYSQYDSMDKETSIRKIAALIESIAAAYPNAKQELIGRGFTAEQLEKMPATQVVMLSGRLITNDAMDDMAKWAGIPFIDGAQPLLAAEKRLKAPKNNKEAGAGEKIYSLLTPRYSLTYFAQHRTSRRLTALRVVEALRMHAALNGGQWPKSLDEVKQVPLPLDPGLGKAFSYTQEEGRVTVTAPLWSGDPTGTRYAGLKYVLTIRP